MLDSFDTMSDEDLKNVIGGSTKEERGRWINFWRGVSGIHNSIFGN